MSEIKQTLNKVIYPKEGGIPNRTVLVSGTDGTNTFPFKTTNTGEMIIDTGGKTLPVDATISVDSMNLSAEMKVDSGHDLYKIDPVTNVDDLEISFGAISGLALSDIQSFENRTKGWIYNTTEATVTTTGIVLDATEQKAGYPVIAATDEIEVVYRGVSRFDDKAKDLTLTDGTQKAQIVDDLGEVIGATANALDVNIKSNATDLDNANDDVLVYGFDGAANQKIKTHTDGALQIKSIADTVVVSGAVTTDVETGLAKEDTLATVNTNLETIETDIEATNTALADGTQKTQVVDGTGNVIASTTNALDVYVKGGVALQTNVFSITAEYKSPIDFTATYTSSTTITLSLLPFTTVDSSQIVYIKYIVAGGGSSGLLVNGREGITITCDSGVLTVDGAGTPFAAGDVYEVGINAQTKAYDDSTNSMMTSQLNPDYLRYTDVEALVTAQALTASYADFGAEIDMRGFNTVGIWVTIDVNDSQDVDLKVLGKHTSAGADEFEIDGLSVKRLWTGAGTDSKIYYEFETGSIPYLQIQAVAGTLGATAGTLTIAITKSY